MKREVINKHMFKESGTFQSYHRACDWLSDNGYSFGSMCGDQPIGILKGEYLIAKWKNLTNKEKGGLDGVMLSGDFREGEVIIQLYK